MYIVKLHIGSNYFLLSNLQTVYKGFAMLLKFVFDIYSLNTW